MSSATGASVAILGVGLWTRTIPDAGAWLRGEPGEPVVMAPGAGLDRRTKRRAGPLTRALSQVFFEAVTQAQADVAEVATVFGSALGECRTMLSLLDQMWRTHEPVSPLAFATSVHNAASGAVSISSKNRNITTSIAADYDTPAMGLIEGIGLVAATGAPVVVACGDEAAPEGLVPEEERFNELAAAIVLGPLGAEGHALASLSAPRIGDAATLAGAALPDALARNPQVGLVDLVDAVLRQASGALRLDRGRGRGWTVSVTA